jgi:DNA helicase HerA-like ATPase
MNEKGIIVAGNYAELVVREKAGERLELGELLVARDATGQDILLQVTDLAYGSQISEQNRELLSGLALEDGVELTLQDERLRTYTLAHCKPLLRLKDFQPPKGLPSAFSSVYAVQAGDIRFAKPEQGLFLGNLRSGSKELPLAVHVNARDALTHHVLIAATTGRGKSNLMKVLLQDLLEKDYASVLVFDPHGEYADALSGKRLAVYSSDPSPGEFTLKINVGQLRPQHFDGAAEWSDAQRDALRLYYRRFKAEWIERVLVDEQPFAELIKEGTFAVLKRRLSMLLALDVEDGQLVSRGVFDPEVGTNTIPDITRRLQEGAVVIVETGALSDAAEVLMAALLTTDVYGKWKRERPTRVLSICLEEAPRFIGADAIAEGPNVFNQIAREGRKFNVGLVAITQLPSLIPRQVLANINTKIILGIEMAPERKAIIESSPQDLSRDDRVIASLQKGEAIVTSTFTAFATPVRVPLHKKPQAPIRAVQGLKQ